MTLGTTIGWIVATVVVGAVLWIVMFWSLSIRKTNRIRMVTSMLSPPRPGPERGVADVLAYCMESARPDVQKRRAMAVEAMVAEITTNFMLKSVCEKHGATEKDLREIHALLVRMSDFWSGGHWIPVSSLMMAEPLDFLLRNRDRLAYEQNVYVVNNALEDYFSSIRSGRITATLMAPAGGPAAP